MSKQSSPDYELPPGHPSTRFPQLDIPLNHAVLRDIRTIVQILRYDGPLRDFLGDGPLRDFSIPVPRDDIVHLFDAWRGIERVFGDLDDNRLHPNGWDKLRFVFSSKSERGDTDSLLEDNNEDTSNVGPMNRSLWVIHKGKSHRSCTEDMSLPFLWGVAPCFMGCTTKASLNFQILERTIF